jgi:hypothetical protein
MFCRVGSGAPSSMSMLACCCAAGVKVQTRCLRQQVGWVHAWTMEIARASRVNEMKLVYEGRLIEAH